MKAAEIIGIIPSLLWLAFVVVLLILFYKPIRDEILPSLTRISAMGVEISFVSDSMTAAIEVAQKSPEWKVVVPEEAKRRTIKRAQKSLEMVRGAQILWVDDQPSNNINERRMFRQLKMDIDAATSTDELSSMLANSNYDFVISDMVREGDTIGGLRGLERLRQEGHDVPMIFYVGVVDESKGVPAGAFGLTNRPDELLHLAIDIMERRKA